MKMSATIYTKVSEDMNGLIDSLAEERGIKKAEVIKDLLEKGLNVETEFSEAEEMKNKVLEVESLKEAVSGLDQKYAELSTVVIQRLDEFADAIRGLRANDERHHVKMHELESKVEKNGEEGSKENNPNNRRWSVSDIGKKKD